MLFTSCKPHPSSKRYHISSSFYDIYNHNARSPYVHRHQDPFAIPRETPCLFLIQKSFPFPSHLFEPADMPLPKPHAPKDTTPLSRSIRQRDLPITVKYMTYSSSNLGLRGGAGMLMTGSPLLFLGESGPRIRLGLFLEVELLWCPSTGESPADRSCWEEVTKEIAPRWDIEWPFKLSGV
jgi:hypothetical protein